MQTSPRPHFHCYHYKVTSAINKIGALCYHDVTKIVLDQRLTDYQPLCLNT